MAKIISLFNHKGGVSKTTTTFNLGWKLAELGQTVLIVDADPQCNLTGLALGIEDYDELNLFYDSKKNTDIYTSLAPRFGFESIPGAAVPPTVIKGNGNLSILAGNIKFGEIDLQIASALGSSGAIPILKQFIGAPFQLIRSLAENGRFDIVLVDMSPSVSATNMCLLMSSDYFIIPTSPDFFCCQAIDSLSTVLPDWASKLAPFRDSRTLPVSTPKLLGVISQNYRVSTSKQKNDEVDTPKQMSKSFQQWADKIKVMCNTKLVPSLEKLNMVVDKEKFLHCVAAHQPYNLANIQDFNSLIPIAQSKSKPFFNLTKEDSPWSGKVWEIAEANIKIANETYTDLANSILKLITTP